MSEPMSLTPPPPPGGGAPPPAVAPIPWEDRQRLGFVTAAIENVKLFVTAPQEAYRRTREKGDLGSPILWTIIIGVVAGVIRWIWGLMFAAPSLAFLPAEARAQFAPILAMMAGGGIVTVILTPIFAVIGLFIGGAILHLCLMLVKGLDQSTAGFEGTVRAIAYGQVAQLAQIVPFVGGLIAMVWGIFLYVVGLSTLHKTTQGKALAAVLIPVALCCVCLILVFLGVGAAIFSAANH
jgi:hypothetical protein